MGVTSRMFVGWKTSHDDQVRGLRGYAMLQACDQFLARLWWCLGVHDLGYFSSLRLMRREWFRQADVIQLYNTHWNYFAFPLVARISRLKPLVWRLSDQWPMTGHCGYSHECERWRVGCGKCPDLQDYPPLRRDRTALMWRIKQRVYRRSRLVLVAPSGWMRDLVTASPLLQAFPVHLIPNGVDCQVFRPIPKRVARLSLGLPPDGKYVLCPVNKGFAYARDAVEQVTSRLANMSLLTFGRSVPENTMATSHYSLGELQDDRLLALAYAAADVYLHPALADNLPNAVIESMACGTPVLTWRIGGIPDAVRHMETGYLADYRSIESLADGLICLLSTDSLREQIAERCRRVVESEYSSALEAQRFSDLYRTLCGKKAFSVVPEER
jgi:glycosyltransferase involved in cell wall biosynthesis